MSTSLKKSRRGDGESFDRFSNIPDCIVHKILSLLPTKDIARTSLVSKRFRELCLYVPDLFLDFASHILKNLGNWTERFLTLRNGAKLRRFVLNSSNLLARSPRLDALRVSKWIHNATVICNAEELDVSLEMSEDECISLPLSIFVRTINFRLGKGILKLPSSISTSSFSSLQVLEIRSLSPPQNLEEDWVSSLFPVIKKLTLENIMNLNNLNITSSSLECLSLIFCGLLSVTVSAERLQTLDVDICYHSSMSVLDDWLFRIYAPSLQKVYWGEDLFVFKSSSICLQSASFDTSRLVQSADVLLQFIKHAKSVALFNSFLEEGMFTEDLRLLDNVQNLDTEVRCGKNHEMTALAGFFRRLPNLETLTMRCDEYCFSVYKESNDLLALEPHDFDIEYWESQEIAFIHHLKEANIEIHHWGFEVGLIKYLIKHATALERMTVTFSRYVDISRSPIRKKLSEFHETFSRATLDFVLK
ncbi:putative F-box/FBD/LRR-repeat protein At4g03220 [Cornus florida]|uniref:putative F-box/FBD/LRR-repeat protein At4g03220 n=1 Tax=Cornus florida TaxID=4283 RepID=UPI0028A16586|nr:putative F-box/FBD/LRR-repeat protein At4g03220 [Cornus florida]